jgi:hypothetical protein
MVENGEELAHLRRSDDLWKGRFAPLTLEIFDFAVLTLETITS